MSLHQAFFFVLSAGSGAILTLPLLFANRWWSYTAASVFLAVFTSCAGSTFLGLGSLPLAVVLWAIGLSDNGTDHDWRPRLEEAMRALFWSVAVPLGVFALVALVVVGIWGGIIQDTGLRQATPKGVAIGYFALSCWVLRIRHRFDTPDWEPKQPEAHQPPGVRVSFGVVVGAGYICIALGLAIVAVEASRLL